MTAEDPERSSFLSTARSRPLDRRLAAATIGTAFALFVAALPFAHVPLPHLPGFIPSYAGALVVVDLVTALLLIGQFRQLRAPSLLLLGSGYLFDSMITALQALSFPGAFAEAGLLGGEQTAPWLYAMWHAAFPLLTMLYAMIAHTSWDTPVDPARVGPSMLLAVVWTMLAVGLCTMLATIGGEHLLPELISGDALTNFTRQGAIKGWLIAAAAPVLLWWRTRLRTVLDLWLFVTMVTWVLDMLLSTVLITNRFDLGWYAGRVFGLMAASFVLGALMLETGHLYASLLRALAETRARAQALAESQAQLRHAQKLEAMGQLTGGVAHDFNNLLTVIVGNLDLIQRRVDDARVQRLVAAAQRAAERGGKLTQQLLVFARRQVLRPATVNPNRLLLDFEGLLRRALGETIALELDLDTAVDPVHIDPGQFEAAVLNLVINARDAMGPGGVVRVSTRNETLDEAGAAGHLDAKAGAFAVIGVTDTGCGIPSSLLPQVFDPFFTTKEVGKGSGLGLSQVYGFVTESGGHVRIDSTERVGTTVSLWLPRSSERVVEPVAEARDGALPLRAASPDEVVLVVEDDPDVRALAAESLRNLGYKVLLADHATQALAQLALPDQRIDILFSDIVMPGGMNGAQLAREARRLRPRLKVLLTSGYTADMPAAAEGGDAPLLRKPYRPEELASSLRLVLGGRA